MNILQGKRANKARKLVKELIDDGGEEDDKNKRSKMLVMHIRDFSKDVQSFLNSKAENFLYHLFIKIM